MKAVMLLLLALCAAPALGARRLLQEGTQQLPQFLLAPLPPTGLAQGAAVLAAIGGNVNSFANAVQLAEQTSGIIAVARPFSDAIGEGRASDLLNSIVTAASFGRADIAPLLNEAFSLAVSDQIGRGQVGPASDAVAQAFNLQGGAGAALALSRQLSLMIESVGCTDLVANTLNSAGQQATEGEMFSALTFATAAAQNPSVSSCWASVGGETAARALQDVQPVIVVPVDDTDVTAPVGAVQQQTVLAGQQPAASVPTPEEPDTALLLDEQLQPVEFEPAVTEGGK